MAQAVSRVAAESVIDALILTDLDGPGADHSGTYLTQTQQVSAVPEGSK